MNKWLGGTADQPTGFPDTREGVPEMGLVSGLRGLVQGDKPVAKAVAKTDGVFTLGKGVFKIKKGGTIPEGATFYTNDQYHSDAEAILAATRKRSGRIGSPSAPLDPAAAGEGTNTPVDPQTTGSGDSGKPQTDPAAGKPAAIAPAAENQAGKPAAENQAATPGGNAPAANAASTTKPSA